MDKELYARDVVPFGPFKGLTLKEINDNVIDGERYLINLELSISEFYQELKRFNNNRPLLKEIMRMEGSKWTEIF